jgi:protein involved in polysaccharide export with SLBB domain
MKTALFVTLLLWSTSVTAASPLGAQHSAPGPVGTPASAGAGAAILPGDQVSLRIFREPELSGVFNVAENGSVVLPRLGRVQVEGLTAAALQDTLLSQLSVYLNNPAVEVTVLRRVAVHGEVRRPDLYMVDLTMTVRDVIARAGGVTEVGNPNRITLVRDGEHIRLDRGDGARLSTAELRSGDQLVVARRGWLEMNALGAVSTAAVVVSVMTPIIRSVWR